MKDFHCCATCMHFRPIKNESGMKYFCERLNYETSPKYQFNCWNPKEQIKKLLNKQSKPGQDGFLEKR